MSSFKVYSIFVFIFSFSAIGQSHFNSKECLEADYDASIEHAGKLFGLIKNKMDLTKKGCLVHIKFKNILETEWKIDYCREPIHMKVTNKGSESVYKRRIECADDNTSDFCLYYKELVGVFEDFGLIFSKGEREKLDSEHGKVYCTYLLTKKYLLEGMLFSKYTEMPNIIPITKSKDESCDLPKTDAIMSTPAEPIIAPAEVAPKDDLPKF